MSISVTGLSKIYGQQKAVNNISFSVGKGEIVGFLGPNGAGKSTTMKIITGYLQPDSGTVEVCGTDVVSNPIATKSKIGYLPESNPLYYDMYVREYLAFAADVHHVKNKYDVIEKIIAQVGLTREAAKKIGQLSKGYKQRVGLAAALLHDPEVLILDEPTTGLDPNQIIEIREVIKTLGKDKTVLFSSHILQEVEAICNRVVIINRGDLVADDTITNLHQHGRGKNVVNVAFKENIQTEMLHRLSAAHSVSETSSNNWQLVTNEPELLRKQLLELAIQENLNIVSLNSESQSLEEVFRNLTNTKD